MTAKKYPSDLTGLRFGRWTVVSRAQAFGKGNYKWACQCDCGTVRDVARGSLTQGNSVSCGCYHSEVTHEACAIPCPFTAKRLHELYWKQLQSPPQIALFAAPLLGREKIKPSVVMRWIREAGLTLRSYREAQKALAIASPAMKSEVSRRGVATYRAMLASGERVVKSDHLQKYQQKALKGRRRNYTRYTCARPDCQKTFTVKRQMYCSPECRTADRPRIKWEREWIGKEGGAL